MKAASSEVSYYQPDSLLGKFIKLNGTNFELKTTMLGFTTVVPPGEYEIAKVAIRIGVIQHNYHMVMHASMDRDCFCVNSDEDI